MKAFDRVHFIDSPFVTTTHARITRPNVKDAANIRSSVGVSKRDTFPNWLNPVLRHAAEELHPRCDRTESRPDLASHDLCDKRRIRLFFLRKSKQAWVRSDRIRNNPSRRLQRSASCP